MTDEELELFRIAASLYQGLEGANADYAYKNLVDIVNDMLAKREGE